MAQRRRYIVTGQVQGVGFRPFVYRLATELDLAGWVLNDPGGVTVEVQGDARALDAFAARLRSDAPPLARIDACDAEDVPPRADEGEFVIRPSDGGELTDAQVTVDTAVCDDCLREMRDPDDRRFRYPLINCTNCGPRYSIVRSIPYDRPNTTMAAFEMCPACAAEYGDPASRRFHAQPIACPVCGPSVWLADAQGRRIECDDPVAAAAGRIADGKIVAIKGLGGFHLACLADDEHAVRRLRRRKARDAKPFALMAPDMAAVRRFCDVNPAAERLLTGPIRPIVLLARRPDAPVAEDVARGLDTLGVMLPYTPLHHLLFDDARLAGRALVMTSGNRSDEPLVKDNDAAVAHLGRIADALLLHDRPIERRVDDSVVQVAADGRTTLLRRARGYAPECVNLDLPPGPAVLAVGGELKGAVCLCRDGRAVLGEHLGDLTDARTYRHFIDTINHLEELFEVSPGVIAADMHPRYLSAQYAVKRSAGELAGRPAAERVRVQHHHAHVAACLAEHGRTGPAIGLACDGTGYGDDGAVWGCEVLSFDLHDYERIGSLRYTPLPGGDLAAVETWRPALAALRDALGDDGLDAARRIFGGAVPADALDATWRMLESGVNCPPASSLGRWFDATAALAGVALRNDCEGRAPMLLEARQTPGVTDVYPFDVRTAAGAMGACMADRSGNPARLEHASQGKHGTGGKQGAEGEHGTGDGRVRGLSTHHESRHMRGDASGCAGDEAGLEHASQGKHGTGGKHGAGDGRVRGLAMHRDAGDADGPWRIDLRPMVRGIVADVDAGVEAGIIAATFHNTVTAFLLDACRRAREQTGLATVAISGGCFANRTVAGALIAALGDDGFEVLTHRVAPCNDGCIALGQAAVAAAKAALAVPPTGA